MVNERFVLPVVLRPALKNRSTNDAALWILGLLASLSGWLAVLIDSPCDLFVAEISFVGTCREFSTVKTRGIRNCKVYSFVIIKFFYVYLCLYHIYEERPFEGL